LHAVAFAVASTAYNSTVF